MFSLLLGWSLFDVSGSSLAEPNLLLGSDCLTQPSNADCPDAAALGELKACVHTDSIA